MLLSIINQTMNLKCNRCNKEYQNSVPNTPVKYIEEFGEYENLSIQCPYCGTLEIFNMNIPPNDTDELFATGDLPLEEEIQRYYVRLLMRYVREDLKQL